MPVKHQSQSYRNKNGKRFICWGDFCDADTKAAAKAEVSKLKAGGKAAFYESHPEGYARVFVEVETGH